MLRLILTAIRSALGSAVRFLGRVMSLPGRVFGHALGVPGPDDLPELAPPEDLSAGSEPATDTQEIYQAIANLVRTWCADTLIDARPVAVPPGLPRKIKEWLVGLTCDERDAVINADKYAVSAHCQGLYDIAGVRHVGRLPAMSEGLSEPMSKKVREDDLSAPALELAPLATLPGVR
jgi:hypothetical protein